MAKTWTETDVEDALTKALAKSKLKFPEIASLEDA
jgi:hypothetical protein